MQIRGRKFDSNIGSEGDGSLRKRELQAETLYNKMATVRKIVDTPKGVRPIAGVYRYCIARLLT